METKSINKKVLVIGAGPGGYPAAFAAADLGMQVTMVDENPKPGGVCLHRGCIPSKALLHLSKLIGESKEATHWGVTFEPPKIDIDKVRSFKMGVIEKLTNGVVMLAKTRKVNVISARARFTSSTQAELTKANGDKEIFDFDIAIVATGSSPVIPGILKLDDPRVMDSTGALELPDIPKKLLVVGGGYIGLEMSTVYAGLGSEVTVVEMTPTLLPGIDPDLVRPLAKRLKKAFSAIHLETKVEKLEARKEGIIAQLTGKDGQSRKELFDRALIAIGRRPNNTDLGLENTKVQLNEQGFINVNAKRQTDDPTIYAVGDITGNPMLAHKATREAKVAAEAIAGEPAEYDNIAMPAVVFTDPEIAVCGLSETEAKASGREVKITKFPWAASGRAHSLGQTDGFTKLLFDPKTQRLLGIGIVGPGAGELIAEGALAIETAAVARDLSDTIHAHPTLSETIMEAAESMLGQATHNFRRSR